MKPFEPKQPILVKGMGKCSKGHFIRYYERAPFPYKNGIKDGPTKFVEYRCEYNKSVHIVDLARCRHPVKPRIPKQRTTEE